jgi:hypothetical protein
MKRRKRNRGINIIGQEPANNNENHKTTLISAFVGVTANYPLIYIYIYIYIYIFKTHEDHRRRKALLALISKISSSAAMNEGILILL